ncbi:MAG: hypothetical protein IAF38_03925, partial [Bacteroidia bacterium]|nr:hypothetical protein [Bacteroidia bacterium]
MENRLLRILNYMTKYFTLNCPGKIKFLLVFLLTFILPGRNFSQQKKLVTDHAPYVFIYRVFAKEAIAFNAKKTQQKDILAMLHTKVDSFLYEDEYRKKLPEGYYLIVYTEGNSVRVTLELKTHFYAEIKNKNTETVFKLFDENSQKPISDLKVFFGKKQLAFIPEKAGYFIEDKKPVGDLMLLDGKDTIYLALGSQYNQKERVPKNDQKKWEGYIAFNKPIYLPGDTVKVKAYVLYNKKPYKKPVWVQASDYGSFYKKKTIFSKQIAPVKPGAYETQFVCGDTLKIDRDYTVSLHKDKKKFPDYWNSFMEAKFRLEDYQLDEVTYTAYSEKDFFSGKDSVVIVLSAKDFNGMDIVDGKAEIKITTSEILSSVISSSQIPYRVYEKEIPLLPGAETHFKIPASAFPLINATYAANIKFNNSNHETKEITIGFSVFRDQGDLNFVDKMDSLLIEPRASETKGEEATLFIFKQGLQLQKFQLKLPGYIPLTPFFDEVRVEWKNKVFKWQPGTDLLFYSGIRTKDSVLIKLLNARGIEVEYEVLKDNIIAEKGKLNKLIKLKIADSTKAAYTFRYSYSWKGSAETKEQNLLPKEKTLVIKMETPKTIFPGQESEIKISVSDYYGKKMEGANICVTSVN